MRYISPKRKAKQILLGTMLGDSSLTRTCKTRAYLHMGHSSEQVEYLLWKICMLFPLTGSFHVRVRQSCTSKNGEVKYSDNFVVDAYSSTSKYLGHIYNDFYFSRNGKTQKEVKSNVLNRLTPLSVSTWYMDDGSLARTLYPEIVPHSIRLFTCGFSFLEDQLITDYFNKKWNVDFSHAKHFSGGELCHIQIRYKKDLTDWNSFLNLVSPHIIDSMKYKIDVSQNKAERISLQEFEDIVCSRKELREVIRNNDPSTWSKWFPNPSSCNIQAKSRVTRRSLEKDCQLSSVMAIEKSCEVGEHLETENAERSLSSGKERVETDSTGYPCNG